MTAACAVLHLEMPCPGTFWVFLGSCWKLGNEEQGLKLLCTSVEAIPCVLELSLHLCYSKAAKIGVKTQTFAARSWLMVVMSLAGSARRFLIGLH